MEQRGNQKGSGVVMLLLAVCIAGLLYLCVMKLYLRPPTEKLDADTQKVLEAQGMKASGPQDTVRQAQAALEKANNALEQKEREAHALLDEGQTGEEAQRR